MAMIGLLNENPKPTEAEIREGLEGVICRCTGYQFIVKAVQKAVQIIEESGQSIPAKVTVGEVRSS